MNTNFQTFKFSNLDLPGHKLSQLDLLEGWPRLSALLSTQSGLAVLAILITLGLMLAFHQIVLGAVEQGELLQQARNQQSEALRRCGTLRGLEARDNCRLQINGGISASAP